MTHWEKWMLFLPERILPDRFYTSNSNHDDFTDPDFKDYYIRMDTGRDWVSKVYAILEAYPHPRMALGSRPRREPLKITDDTDSGESQDEEESARRYRLLTAPRFLSWFDDQFYNVIMAQCARKQSGLLVVLAREHPMGDFAYCRYRWTLQEQDSFLEGATRWPPRTISDLPASTPMVPISVYARERVGTTRGPSLTAAEARRLHSCSTPRLLFFDLFGSAGYQSVCPMLLVPSDDLSHTQTQRDTYEKVLATNKREDFSPRVPLLAEQLHTSCAVADYTVGSSGSTFFEEGIERWSDVWALLDAFSDVDTSEAAFSFPVGRPRNAERYQVSLVELHQRLVDEHVMTDTRVMELASRQQRDTSSRVNSV